MVLGIGGAIVGGPLMLGDGLEFDADLEPDVSMYVPAEPLPPLGVPLQRFHPMHTRQARCTLDKLDGH